MRIERDFLGEKQVPEDAYYGIHTVRALENFGRGSEPADPFFIKAYLLVKKAACITNRDIGAIDGQTAGHIITAIDTMVEKGDFSDIVVNPLSGGAGTSVNMNVNEVIANRALELAGRNRGDYAFISPLDHVNLHQSTNDTFPTALRCAIMMRLKGVEKALISLQEALQDREKEFGDVVRLGRTELMDALPVTVGQQFSAYAEAIGRDRWRIMKCEERIRTVNLGGTAVGTGFGAPQEYIFRAWQNLKTVTGLPVSRSENLVDATANMDQVVEVVAMVKAAAVNLMKIASDLRLSASGPDGGLGELILPAVQEGSSMMPGKVNPVIPEFVIQSAIQVIHNDSAISEAAGAGNFELNQYAPLIAYLAMKNLKLVEESICSLNNGVVRGIKLNITKITNNMHDSQAILTYLSPLIGHDGAAAVKAESDRTGRGIRDIITGKGLLKPEEYDELLGAERVRMMGIKKQMRQETKDKRQG